MNFAFSEKHTFVVLRTEQFRGPPAYPRETGNFTPLRSHGLRPMSSPALQIQTSLRESKRRPHKMRLYHHVKMVPMLRMAARLLLAELHPRVTRNAHLRRPQPLMICSTHRPLSLAE